MAVERRQARNSSRLLVAFAQVHDFRDRITRDMRIGVHKDKHSPARDATSEIPGSRRAHVRQANVMDAVKLRIASQHVRRAVGALVVHDNNFGLPTLGGIVLAEVLNGRQCGIECSVQPALFIAGRDDEGNIQGACVGSSRYRSRLIFMPCHAWDSQVRME
jgi:hypothetical protein